jgi:molecular chaperone DnaK (HSP70)
MTCQVCNQAYEPNDSDLSFCSRCGWSLGRLNVQFEEDVLTLAGLRPVTLKVICHNSGTGWLQCELGDLPRGVRPAEGTPRQWVVRSDPQEIFLEVNPGEVDRRATELPLVVWANDQRGKHPMDFRPVPREAARKAHTHTVRLQRSRLGPIHLFQELLLFRRTRQPQKLQIQNLGDVSVTVTVHSAEGFLVRRAGENPADRLTLRLASFPTTEEILVEAETPGAEGALRVEIPDLPPPDNQREVQLRWMPEEKLRAGGERWIFGIDFGTANTAIFYLDSHIPGGQPVPVKWEVKGKQRLMVPSLIMYPFNRGMPVFGWDVPEMAELERRNVVIRSIKKRLTEDKTYALPNGKTVKAEEVVESFMRFLIRHVSRQPQFLGEEDLFENARVVMSLPVRDQDHQFEEQKQRTLRAAVQAGLNEDRLLFYPEPECAAVDFLRRRNEFGMAVQNGQLMCVFDCGAGTTDICVLEIHIKDGEVTFTRRALAGFPFGGDVVDELLLRHAVEVLKERGVLAGNEEDFSQFRLTGDRAPRSRPGVLNDLRLLKEMLSFPDREQPNQEAAVQWRYGSKEGEFIEITWELIESKFRPYVQKMLHDGFQPEDIIPDWSREKPEGRKVEVALSSLEQVLWDEKMNPTDIRWLCLTGGSSFIPFIVEMLQHLLPRAVLVPKTQDLSRLSKAEDLPVALNVVQGAAYRPLFRVEGQLQADYYLRFISPSFKSDPKKVLPRGAAPGRKPQQVSFPLARGEAGRLELIAEVNGTRGAVYVLPLENPPTQPQVNILAEVRYAEEMSIHLTVSRAVSGGVQAILPETAVA